MLHHLLPVPADPLFGLQKEFLACKNPKKVNLGIGIYADDEGKPFVPKSIQNAAKNIDTKNFNYVAMRGDQVFLDHVGKMLFGECYDATTMASQQTAGGTHGVKIFSDLVERTKTKPRIFFPIPTWANHYALLQNFEIAEFPHLHWEKTTEKTDVFFAMEEYEHALQNANEGDFLLLHGGKTHNPTGMNASLEELKKIIALANAKKIFLLVDYAYFGLGEGFEEDQKFSKIFAETAENFAMVVSFSKNAALYRHRLGALFIKTSSQNVEIINQNLENIVRETISNPPAFGSMIMNTIFEHCLEEWKQEMEEMRKNLDARRMALYDDLGEKFFHLQKTRGMFALLGIPNTDVEILKNNFSIFLPSSGRINFGGLKPSDVKTVTDALKQC